MHTIKLNVDEKAMKNLLKMLEQFNKNEVEIIYEDEHFMHVRKEMVAAYNELKDEQAKLMDIDELEQVLDKNITDAQG